MGRPLPQTRSRVREGHPGRASVGLVRLKGRVDAEPVSRRLSKAVADLVQVQVGFMEGDLCADYRPLCRVHT
jgi:hypothetical protein